MSATNTPIDYDKCYRDLSVCTGIGLIVCCFSMIIGTIIVAALLVLTVLVAIGQFAARLAAHAALAKRADEQNAAVERGEAYGIYGEYPPAPLYPPLRKLTAKPTRPPRPPRDWRYGTVHGQRVMLITPL